MKVKSVFLIGTLTIIALFDSCSTGTRVASSFSKRKYTKGYFFNVPAAIPATTPVTASNTATHTSSTPVTVKHTAPVTATQQNTDAKPATKAAEQKRAENTQAQTFAQAAKTNTQTNSAAVNQSEEVAPLATDATQARGGSTSRASIYGFILGLLGFAMAVGAIGSVLVPVVCVIGLLLCIHGLLKRDYKLFAVIGLILCSAGLVLWIIGIAGGSITFSII